MKKIIVAMVVYLLCTGSAYAEVSQFVFTNEGRTVAPGVISESLTIQSQNSSGIQESILETADLVFQSSSPTGEFLNSSGNPVSTTMSKNTANRTFYYRDNTTGTYTLTVVATGRDSQKTFRTTQQIIVGGTQTQTEQNSDSSNGTTSTVATFSSVGTSSHSSPSPTSGSKEIVIFDVSAGRERFSSVGNDIVFKAEPVKLSGIPENYIQYIWTFGDGTIAHGQVVSHRYKFAGDYVVVLNATYNDKSAVSRTEVLVINPSLSLEIISGGVKITNISSGEVNLGEWVIEDIRNRFEIPQDTIIQKGKTITFSYGAVVRNDVVTLKNPLGLVVAENKYEEKLDLPQVSTSSPVVVSEQKIKIVYVEKPVAKKEIKVSEVEEVETVPEIISEPENDLVAAVYTASPKSSALESFLWIPKKGWGILTGLFR